MNTMCDRNTSQTQSEIADSSNQSHKLYACQNQIGNLSEIGENNTQAQG